jgi:hypothetical protein
MIGAAISGDHQRKDDEWRNRSNGFSRFTGKPACWDIHDHLRWCWRGCECQLRRQIDLPGIGDAAMNRLSFPALTPSHSFHHRHQIIWQHWQ